MKKLLIENLSENITLIQKVEFEAVDEVFNALDFAFHPEGFEDDPDERFLALWRLFLISAGWCEDDYWMELEYRHHKCDKCKEKEALEKSNAENSDKNPEKKLN